MDFAGTVHHETLQSAASGSDFQRWMPPNPKNKLRRPLFLQRSGQLGLPETCRSVQHRVMFVSSFRRHCSPPSRIPVLMECQWSNSRPVEFDARRHTHVGYRRPLSRESRRGQSVCQCPLPTDFFVFSERLFRCWRSLVLGSARRHSDDA